MRENKAEKSKKRIGIIISIALIICLISSIFAFADDEYEYNDVAIYINGQYNKIVALTSENWLPSYCWFEVYVQNGQDLYIVCQGGTPIDTGIDVTNVTNLSATQNGSFLNQYYDINTAHDRFTNVITANFPEVQLYINTSGSGQVTPPSGDKLATPVVTVNGNYISWNTIPGATSYAIQYKPDQTGVYQWEDPSFQGTSYLVNKTGYYTVQAKGSGYTDSDWSVSTYIEYQEERPNNILEWIMTKIQNFINGIQNAFRVVSNAISDIGIVFEGLTSFMPEQYSTLLWSLASLLLMFGLFRLL